MKNRIFSYTRWSMPLLRLLLLTISTATLVTAQESKHTYTLGANAYQGFLLVPSENVAQFAQTRPVGVELFINKNTYGYSYWEHRYACPDIGFSLTYTDYLNPVLGQSIGGTLYMDVPLMRRQRSLLTLGLGVGLGYHTRPYRPPIETGNILLGTPVTLTMRTQLTYSYVLSSHWRANLSAKLIHYSNAAYSIPNRGVNMPMVNLGVSRRLSEQAPAYATAAEVSPPEPYQRLSYYLGVSTGMKTLTTEGPLYNFVNLHAYTTLRLSAISGLTGGVDVFLDQATRNYIRQRVAHDRPDHRRVALVAGHELFYQRLSLLTQVGVYVYRPFRNLYLPVYQRFGVRYALTRHLLGNFTLKVHGGRAELVELGLGVRL
ncbi:MAG: acyloxyacyl hydrolase [Tunicatimonas sp.]